MERCWADNPDDRPTFEMIRSIIRCIRKWVYKSHIVILNYLAGLYTDFACAQHFGGNCLEWQKTGCPYWHYAWFSSDTTYILDSLGFIYGILWPFIRGIST
jgi:hypothetical protein